MNGSMDPEETVLLCDDDDVDDLDSVSESLLLKSDDEEDVLEIDPYICLGLDEPQPKCKDQEINLSQRESRVNLLKKPFVQHSTMQQELSNRKYRDKRVYLENRRYHTKRHYRYNHQGQHNNHGYHKKQQISNNNRSQLEGKNGLICPWANGVVPGTHNQQTQPKLNIVPALNKIIENVFGKAKVNNNVNNLQPFYHHPSTNNRTLNNQKNDDTFPEEKSTIINPNPSIINNFSYPNNTKLKNFNVVSFRNCPQTIVVSIDNNNKKRQVVQVPLPYRTVRFSN